MRKEILIIAAVVFGSCNGKEQKKSEIAKQSYESTKESLKDKEQKDPKNFLLVDGQNRHNLIGQTVIKGTITNKASVASYKDVDVKLSFYSKTGTLLETDKETIYEVIDPGKSKNFKTKYFAPKGTDSVAFQIEGAKVLDH